MSDEWKSCTLWCFKGGWKTRDNAQPPSFTVIPSAKFPAFWMPFGQISSPWCPSELLNRIDISCCKAQRRTKADDLQNDCRDGSLWGARARVRKRGRERGRAGWRRRTYPWWVCNDEQDERPWFENNINQFRRKKKREARRPVMEKVSWTGDEEMSFSPASLTKHDTKAL